MIMLFSQVKQIQISQFSPLFYFYLNLYFTSKPTDHFVIWITVFHMSGGGTPRKMHNFGTSRDFWCNKEQQREQVLGILHFQKGYID
ncbi:hypothetical protein FGO68_gene5858 [Halteria grandinella]|uniref:Uncharacterized protein n=1 Tax=Halteria grandinella TaxID=5974 RepID=A0A8J8P5M6_HALGN|nr:hypothetical protein FGO68_gene5858 [Halteria grandinella]